MAYLILQKLIHSQKETSNMAYIYVITNEVNDKKYVGFTTQEIYSRFHQHKYQSNNLDTSLARAIRKYGFDNFNISVLEESSDSDYLLEVRETYWIKKLKTVSLGYNRTYGGENYIFSDDVINKLSEAAKKRTGKLNNFYGKSHSSETKKKIGLKSSEKVYTKEYRKKLSDGISKTYKVTFPDGKVKIIKNLYKFCQENNLHSSCMSNVVKGNRKQHKGFVAEYYGG